jgi:hypothetical protein
VNVVCGECGETNRSGTEFCIFCGHFLAWDPNSEPSSPAGLEVPADHPGWRPPQSLRATGQSAPDGGQQVPPHPKSAFQPRTSSAVPSQGQPGCPDCGRPNDVNRRFCTACGRQLVASPGRVLGHSVERSGWRRWWERLWDTKERSARRAYRRSLPPLYRWRRVLIGLLALVLVGGGAVALRQSPRDPVASAVEKWYETRNRNRFITVDNVQASLDPARRKQRVGRLVDNSRDAWTTPWPGEKGSDCQPPEGVSVIVLTFPRTRIQRMDFYSGLSEKLSDRPQQFRPKKLGIRFDAGPCRSIDLSEDKYEHLDVVIDSGRPVNSMRIAVESAHKPTGDGPQKRLSIAEVSLETHPRKVF